MINKQTLLLLSIVGVGLAFYFGLIGTATFITPEIQIQSPNPDNEGSFNLGSDIGNYDFTWLGDDIFIHKQGTCGTYEPPYSYVLNGYYDRDYLSNIGCLGGDFDVEFSIKSTLQDGSSLKSELILVTGEGGNYNSVGNEFNIKLPAGKIIMVCNIYVRSERFSESVFECGLNGEKFRIASLDEKEYRVLYEGTGTKTLELILDKETDVNFYMSANAYGSDGGLASGDIEVTFEPEIEEEVIINDETDTNEEEQTTDTPSSSVSLTFIEKINAWFDNLFAMIFGGEE